MNIVGFLKKKETQKDLISYNLFILLMEKSSLLKDNILSTRQIQLHFFYLVAIWEKLLKKSAAVKGLRNLIAMVVFNISYFLQ